MRRLAAFSILAFAAVGVVALASVSWIKAEVDRPGPHRDPVRIVLQSGAALEQIADQLAEAGALRHPTIFRLAARFERVARHLKAGEYEVEGRASQRDILDMLVAGRTYVRRLTIPEGLSVHEIIVLLSTADGLTGTVTDLPPEGRLLPDTYHYAFGDTRGSLIARMRQKMDQFLAKAWSSRRSGLPLKSPEQTLVMASIVEKETARADERPRVAAVFLNRLRKGMRLQSDPTVIYGITLGERPLGRRLTRKDIETPSDFNTYAIRGLPPHPIANPGRAAIEAVLNPLASTDLYFVADGKGGHAFAKTLAAHNKNVARWRRLRKKAVGAGRKATSP
jgi:UPF0755 protein